MLYGYLITFIIFHISNIGDMDPMLPHRLYISPWLSKWTEDAEDET